MFKLTFLGLVLLSIGCTTASPTSGKKVPREHRAECRKVCDGLDMKLAAMVVVSASSGCVCEMKTKTNMSKMGGASGVAGGAVIALQKQQQQQQQQQQSRSSGHGY